MRRSSRLPQWKSVVAVVVLFFTVLCYLFTQVRPVVGGGAPPVDERATNLDRRISEVIQSLESLKSTVRRRQQEEQVLLEEVRDLSAAVSRLEPPAAQKQQQGQGQKQHQEQKQQQQQQQEQEQEQDSSTPTPSPAPAAGGSVAQSSLAPTVPPSLGAIGGVPTCFSTVDNAACIFPFVHQGRVHTTCAAIGDDAGSTYCATEVTVAGQLVAMGKCGGWCLRPVLQGLNRTRIVPAYGAPVQSCGDAEGLSPSCACHDADVTLPCPKHGRTVDCGYLCAAVFEGTSLNRQMQIAHWNTTYEPSADLVDFLFQSWRRHFAGLTLKEVADYHPPLWKLVSSNFAGAGIATFSGGERLATTVANMIFLQRSTKTALPVEIWHDGTEPGPTPGMLMASAAHRITHYRLPESAGVKQFSWEDRWKNADGKFVLNDKQAFVALKALIVLLSTFETVLFIDDDAVPVADPVSLLRLAEGHSGVFFRDIWSLWKDAKIWKDFEWPGGKKEYSPSQDSGVMVVAKGHNRGEGWVGLCTAGYLNFHHKMYYPAIYQGGFREKYKNGFEAIGTGDKDTFQVAWIVRKIPHRMMGPVSFIGSKDSRKCGSSLGQHDDTGRLAVIHFNGHKFKYSDWNTGRFKAFRDIDFTAMSFKNKRKATDSFYDGRLKTQVRWVKGQDLETYCLRWHKQEEEEAHPRHVPEGWLGEYLDNMESCYASPFMTEFADSFGLRNVTASPR